nr:MAG TPA: hypothetical protein [Caudoviricetes sp.]
MPRGDYPSRTVASFFCFKPNNKYKQNPLS